MEEVHERTVYEPYGFVYITTNMVNGKKYLGQKKFSDGWESYIGSGLLFKQAVGKYGKENFKRIIVQFCYSEEELNDVEYKLSVDLNVVKSDDWYNLVYGGESGSGWSPPDYWREKRSKYMKEKWKDKDYYTYMCSVNSGEKHPLYGEPVSDEVREKISSSLKGKYIGENSPNYGKKRSEEMKQHLRDINTGKHVGELNHMYGRHMFGVESGNHKPLYCPELNEIFWGGKGAEEKYGVNRKAISRACIGKTKHAGKNSESGVRLSWLYAEDAIKQGYITQEDLDNYLNSLKNRECDSNEN